MGVMELWAAGVPSGRLDERCDLSVLRIFTCSKPSHDADTVNLSTVLAQLALAFKPHDRDPHPNDASQLRGDVIGGRVSDTPWIGPRPLMLIGQSRHHF
jgi:hypothetical protein